MSGSHRITVSDPLYANLGRAAKAANVSISGLLCRVLDEAWAPRGASSFMGDIVAELAKENPRCTTCGEKVGSYHEVMWTCHGCGDEHDLEAIGRVAAGDAA